MTRDREVLTRLKKAMRAIPCVMASGDIGTDLDSTLAMMDIETLLQSKGGDRFTEKQKYVLEQCLFQGYTELEIAEKLGVTQQAVSYSLTAALKKLYKLMTCPGHKRKCVSFSIEETNTVIRMYNLGESDKDIAIVTKKPLKSIRNKIRYLREKGVIGVVSKVRKEECK